ncbi:MAG: replication initiator protein A [Betaproteobacteria bacterium]|nr:replication initiator protein A [Betaproteobacteria bacterium]
MAKLENDHFSEGMTIVEDVVQLELFVPADNPDLAFKEDNSSLELPLFSLSKNKDIRIREFTRGGRFVRIVPSVVGAATQFDKDLLIYAVSKIVQAREEGRPISRRIRIKTFPFLEATRRSQGGAAYTRVVETCMRLKGTTLVTNVKSTEEESTEGFGFLDDFKVTRRTKNGKGAIEVEVTISEWLYRATLANDILTLNPEYFSLSQPLERRLAELARKHCGDKAFWKIGIDLLHEKTGSQQTPRRFKQELKGIIAANRLPDYRVTLDEANGRCDVVFLTKNTRKLLAEMVKGPNAAWLQRVAMPAITQP